MNFKKIIIETLRWIFKVITIPLGFVIMFMPIVPVAKEYLLDAPARDFGIKEILIFLIGIFILRSGIYSQKTLESIQGWFSNLTSKNNPK